MFPASQPLDQPLFLFPEEGELSKQPAVRQEKDLIDGKYNDEPGRRLDPCGGLIRETEDLVDYMPELDNAESG